MGSVNANMKLAPLDAFSRLRMVSFAAADDVFGDAVGTRSWTAFSLFRAAHFLRLTQREPRPISPAASAVTLQHSRSGV